MKYTDGDEKGWELFCTIPEYPYSFTGLIALRSPDSTIDLLILGGIKQEKEN